MFTEWCCISKCFRRGELVYIQLRDSVMHGFTLNERDDLNYFRERPGGVIAYAPCPCPARLAICPGRGDENGSCKLFSADYYTLDNDGKFTAEFLRFTHLCAEEEPP